MPELSPRDRDLMIRTVLGEAGNEPDVGKAAVASVILNRVASGRYGPTASHVVLAPSQFEPWQTRPNQLLSYSPDSPAYKKVGGIVDELVNGTLPDVTGGKTHFMNEGIVRQRYGGLPSWARGDRQQIFNHTFYAPNGPVQVARSSEPMAGKEPDKAAISDEDFLKSWGVPTEATKPASPAPANSVPTSGASSLPSDDDFLKSWGVTPQSSTGANAPVAKVEPKAEYGGKANRVANAAAGGFLEGIPIVGPALKEGGLRLGAAARSVLNDTKYSDELDFVRKATGEIEADNKLTNVAGNVAGGIFGYGLAGAAGAGRLLGMSGPTIPSRIVAGGLSGAAIGAADSAARGQDPTTGAIVNGGFGALAPPVGAVLGAGGRALVNSANRLMPTGVSGVNRPAANVLGTVINAEGPAAVTQTLRELGPHGMLADAGPSMTALTSGLVGKPGEANTTIVNALTARAAGRDNRLLSDVNAALGPVRNPSAIERTLERARQALSPEYDRALAGASAVDTQQLANALDASRVNLRGPAQRAVEQVRSYLNIPGTNVLDPNPNALLATRQAIDGLLAGEVNPQVIRQLSFARQSVDDALTQAVPGIKAVDAKYAELMRQGEGLVTGSRILDTGKTAARPTDFAAEYAASAIPQGQMVGPSAVPLRVQQGARAEVDRLVGTKANDLGALQNMLQGEGGWNTAKMGTVFGEENTNRLIGAVNRERTFANTTNETIRNSRTQRAQQAESLINAADPEVNLSSANFTGMAMQAAKNAALNPILKVLSQSNNEPMRQQLAQVLTMPEGPARDRLLNELIQFANRTGQLSALGDRAGKAVEAATNLLAPAAAQETRKRLGQ